MGNMPVLWSYGGGRQTQAIAVLIAHGLLPRPDFAWIADTGREVPSTFTTLRDHIQPMLNAVGVTVEVLPPASPKPALYSRKGTGTLLLPVFTGTGKMAAYCSAYWKRERQRSELRARGFGPNNPVRQWFGFSTDEAHRAKLDSLPWIHAEFPLLTMYPLRKDECVWLVRGAGLPTPQRSRCHICPHQQNEEWREVRDDPDLWADAVRTDEALRKMDNRGGVYLHHDNVPLALAGIDETDQEDAFGRKCAGGECFT